MTSKFEYLYGLGAMMPSHVRFFWWLSLAIVACWVLSTIWFLAFPTAHHLASLAKLPADIRELARRIDMQNAIISTSVWGGVTLCLAWLAAFRHLNWARWAFAIVFLFREAIPFLIAAAYHTLDTFLVGLVHENWADPLDYVIPTLSIAAIAFVFSGNARDWFRSPVNVPPPFNVIA